MEESPPKKPWRREDEEECGAVCGRGRLSGVGAELPKRVEADLAHGAAIVRRAAHFVWFFLNKVDGRALASEANSSNAARGETETVAIAPSQALTDAVGGPPWGALPPNH